MSVYSNMKKLVSCSCCKKEFYKRPSLIKKHKTHCCSRKCTRKINDPRKGKGQKAFILVGPCVYCDKLVKRKVRSKNGFIFCNKSCAAKHNNKYKKPHRSIAEFFVERCLQIDYPTLTCLFNSKDIIGLELDIYIPVLKLAIEINGIFHYRPIYGEKILRRNQKNDKIKQERCHQIGIKLIQIDATKMDHPCKNGLDILYELIKQSVDFVSSKHICAI